MYICVTKYIQNLKGWHDMIYNLTDIFWLLGYEYIHVDNH